MELHLYFISILTRYFFTLTQTKYTPLDKRNNNAASEINLPHCGAYTEKGWGILTAAIQGEGEKMIYQQEGNIKA